MLVSRGRVVIQLSSFLFFGVRVGHIMQFPEMNSEYSKSSSQKKMFLNIRIILFLRVWWILMESAQDPLMTKSPQRMRMVGFEFLLGSAKKEMVQCCTQE